MFKNGHGPGPGPAGRSRFWPNVRNAGRTFEIPAERSKFWPNVRNSGRTFGKINMKNAIQGRKTGFQNFSFKQT